MDSAFDRAIFSESTIPLGPGACSFGLPQRPFLARVARVAALEAAPAERVEVASRGRYATDIRGYRALKSLRPVGPAPAALSEWPTTHPTAQINATAFCAIER